MNGEVGFSDGSWHYEIKIGPIGGVQGIVYVPGFETREGAMSALSALELRDVQRVLDLAAE